MAGNLTIGALLTQGIERLRGGSGTGSATRNATSTLGADGNLDARSNLGATPSLDVELLLAYAFSRSRTNQKPHPERQSRDARARRYIQLVDRRAAGEPVAYILGYRDF